MGLTSYARKRNHLSRPLYKGEQRMKMPLDPIDRTAALVISKGVRHQSTKKIVNPHWEQCPACKPPPALNLAGMKFGRFTVIGMLARAKGLSLKQPAKWVVRCACGDYETRSAKSIRNPRNANDCCYKCREVIENKRLHEWRIKRHIDELEYQETGKGGGNHPYFGFA